MECPSCTFQNTPGTRNCVRCQSLLDFSGVSVVPPRASGAASIRLARGSVAVLGFRVRDAVRRARSNSRLRLDDAVTWGAAACSILPGLGQIIVGRKWLGLSLLLVWVLLILVYLTNYGTAAGFVCGTLAISVHCGAVCGLLSRSLQNESVRYRAAFGLAVYFILLAVVYGPAYWGTNELIGVVPARGLRPINGIQEGDLLIHTGPLLRPTLRRGDLVAYRVRAHNAGTAYLLNGMLFDRIVGLPGDTVQIRGREVIVNGVTQSPELAPLGGNLVDFVATAGQDEYIIVPSLLQPVGHGDYRESLKAVAELASHVQQSDVLGRIFWRVGPGFDFGPIKGSLQ